MVFHDHEKRQSKELAPGVRARTFWGERLMLALVDIDAGAVVPDHSHHHEQGGTVLQGELELTVAGETRLLKAGETYLIPGGTRHSARSTGTAVRVLDVFSPVREEYK
jgi:quercetin dioxygenase-like cupin family protein